MSVELLKISKNSNFYLEGNLISTNEVGDINDYLMQLLGFYTTLEKDITLSELIHAFYGIRKFVGNYFSEDYEVARAFATATKLNEPYKCVRFYKSFRIEPDEFMDEDEYVYILPEVEFVKAENGEKGYLKLGDLPVVIDEKLEYRGEDFSFNKKSKFTLLDILCCVFDETTDFVKQGDVIVA